MSEEGWWHVVRASGLVAWLLLTASTLWSLAVSTRIFERRLNARRLLDLHAS